MLWLLLKPLSIGVRLLLIKEGQVLLVKHVYEKDWYLPGGAVEQGETLEMSARREAKEEAGVQIADLRLFGAYTNFENGKSDHVVVFISQDFRLNYQSDDEIEYCQFFPLNGLPDPISPGSQNRIDEFVSGHMGEFGIW